MAGECDNLSRGIVAPGVEPRELVPCHAVAPSGMYHAMPLRGDLEDVSVESDVAQAFCAPSVSQTPWNTLLSNCLLTQGRHVGNVCAGRVGCAGRRTYHDAFQALCLTMSAEEGFMKEVLFHTNHRTLGSTPEMLLKGHIQQ